MPAPASAFAALGLEPGADREAIERAYRELIKRYHPDRSGGDAARAAEINRAYFELRREHQADAMPLEPKSPAPARPYRDTRRSPRRRRGRAVPLLLLAAVIVLLIERERIVAAVPDWLAALENPRAHPVGGSAASLDSAALEAPLDEKAVARSITQAIELSRRDDEQALADRSRDCHRRMRADPSIAQLDRCAAFDDAAAALADQDPLHDSGVFSAAALTARQMTAAGLLSSDYLAIERRLDRIRMAVQLTLRPPPPPQKVVVEPEPELPAEPL